MSVGIDRISQRTGSFFAIKQNAPYVKSEQRTAEKNKGDTSPSA